MQRASLIVTGMLSVGLLMTPLVLALSAGSGRETQLVLEPPAVGGFDDSKAATSTLPQLTTIRQPWNRVSAEMVRLLLGLLGGDAHSAVILPTELVIRDSA